MKITVDFYRLKELANQMGPPVHFTLAERERAYEPIDVKLEDGIDVDFSQVGTRNSLLEHQGRPIFLYIKDHTFSFGRALEDPSEGNKYHLVHCRTLEGMVRRNRDGRYRVMNGFGGFPITSEHYPDRVERVDLRVCQNCLTYLNYKGAREGHRRRREVAENFNRREFLTTYSTVFQFMPQLTAEDKEEAGYTDDWTSISRALRQEQGYACTQCRVVLADRKDLCHVHHINGVKNDNRRGNLKVLCADCHRKEHHGSMFVRAEDMQVITYLRNQQGLLKGLNWGEVLKLADSAVLGELDILRRMGWPAPDLFHKHLKVLAMWPKKRAAIVLKRPDPLPATVEGWEIHELGEIAKRWQD